MPVTLYQIQPSFYSQLARLALVEKGVDWVERSVNIGPEMENYEPWFMRLHPSGVVPVLDHNGKIVREAIQIIRYVDEQFEGPALTPDDPVKSQRMDEWLQRLNAFPVREYSYGLMLKSKAKPMIGHSFNLRRKTLQRHMKQTPELADLYQARLDDIDAWQKISTNQDEVDKLGHQAQLLLNGVEQELAHGKPWLLGEQYTLVDIWLTVFLSRLRFIKKSHWWKDGRRPLVNAYMNRLRARPSFQGADIWDNFRLGPILRMVAPFLLPRLAVIVTVISVLFYGVWWLFQS